MKLRIEKAIYGGASLARVPADGPPDLAGKAVFVPLALPGELVEATIATDRRSYITATLDSVLEPSPTRITPGCEYYGRCGGCHYQHADYAAQLAMKRGILVETLERAHVPVPAKIRIRSADPWAYRNRVRLHVTGIASASATAKPPRIAICPSPTAPSQRPSCNTPSPHSIELLQKQPALRNDSRRSRVLHRCRRVRIARLAVHEATQIAGATAPIRRRRLRRIAARHSKACARFRSTRKLAASSHPSTWGRPSLDYAVGPLRYQVSAGAFFQVNRYLVPRLARRGRRAAKRQRSPGTSMPASASSPRRSRSSSSRSSPSNLRPPPPPISPAISTAPDTNASCRTRSASFNRRPAARPDLVVVDPPRAGLGAEVCQRLAAVQPTQIVYVSCDPSTLARDLRTLQPSGYRPVALTLIDLFPQTFHLETVATLERI